MPLINPAVLAATRVAVDMRVAAAYKAVTPAQLWCDRIAQEVDSSGKAGITYWLDQMVPRLRKWVGPRHMLGLKRIAQSVLNEEYERTISIPVPDIETDNLGVYNGAQSALGRVAALWPNDLALAALLAGGVTPWLDGQPFFHAAHPLEVPGAPPATQSNLHAAMPLTAANFGTVRGRARLLKGEDGQPLEVGTELLVVAPQALEDTARRILKADFVGFLSNAASTAADANIYKGTADLMVLPALDADSATTWYMLDVGGPIKPLLYQIRKRPNRVVVVDKPESGPVFNENLVHFGVNGSGAGAYGLWQLAHKCEA